MNERIRELMKQADYPAPELALRAQKLAELMVKECMNVIDPGEHQLIARFQARKWLAEHFGVER